MMPLALEATCVYQNNMCCLGTGLAGMGGQEISQRSLLGQSLIAGADSHRAEAQTCHSEPSRRKAVSL